MLQKGVYPYEYIDSWEKFNETFLTEKDDFCGHLDMEEITDAEYTHAKSVYNNFEINYNYHKVIIMIFMYNVIHGCWLMYLRAFKIRVLKYIN